MPVRCVSCVLFIYFGRTTMKLSIILFAASLASYISASFVDRSDGFTLVFLSLGLFAAAFMTLRSYVKRTN